MPIRLCCPRHSWRPVTFFTAATLIASLAVLAPADPIQWPRSAGGNGDFYEQINTTGTVTYSQALAGAAERSYNGMPGHLVIFDNANYAAELQFVNQYVYAPYVQYDLNCCWIGAYRPAGAAGTKYDGWSWADGSLIPASITSNWYVDQFEGADKDEGAVLYSPGPQPGDYAASDLSNLIRGYIVEYGNNASAIPGDANSDGKIDADDYTLIDRGFNKHLPTGTATWSDGDFNYDRQVDQNDYLLIDTAYSQSHGLQSMSGLLSTRESQFGDVYVQELLASVPEPASGLACLFAACLLVSRRRDPHASTFRC